MMDENRKGEIALKVVEHVFFEKGITIPLYQENVKRLAHATGIPEKEMKEFATWVAQVIVEKM